MDIEHIKTDLHEDESIWGVTHQYKQGIRYYVPFWVYYVDRKGNERMIYFDRYGCPYKGKPITVKDQDIDLFLD